MRPTDPNLDESISQGLAGISRCRTGGRSKNLVRASPSAQAGFPAD